MSNTGARIKPEAVREAAFGVIGATYTQMGAVFGGPVRILYIANDSDADVYFSLDGVVDHFRVKANSFRLLDLKTNDIFANTGQAIYQRRVSGAPTTGLVWVEAAYS
ncbi:MAG TPA: hypothetical protein VFO37_04830 [Chitinophagaceae bacterium]|nr:hypothetical protein [Chitinophagaceae bacterium]